MTYALMNSKITYIKTCIMTGKLYFLKYLNVSKQKFTLPYYLLHPLEVHGHSRVLMLVLDQHHPELVHQLH